MDAAHWAVSCGASARGSPAIQAGRTLVSSSGRNDCGDGAVTTGVAPEAASDAWRTADAPRLVYRVVQGGGRGVIGGEDRSRGGQNLLAVGLSDGRNDVTVLTRECMRHRGKRPGGREGRLGGSNGLARQR
ncbi:hypothetical protein GCM10025876_21230 [Demequina litorisediminis]|uniref:Uncharacterized protein n=1 Tax=Demequina litorisediminis TaxID=1849022 RepID=A0ABQ6IDI3_9MICO|nr:hypothetical protein GCM10025876_21230 [Demequina litorisediminis]